MPFFAMAAALVLSAFATFNAALAAFFLILKAAYFLMDPMTVLILMSTAFLDHLEQLYLMATALP